jgi:GAF domain-containing protein
LFESVLPEQLLRLPVITTVRTPTNRSRWPKNQGIRATLSLPITANGQVVGGVNLYANQEHAFDGRHEAVAGIFGAWAGGAVANADLSFTTRQQALSAPATLKANARIHNAVGVIIAIQRVSAHEAQRRLESAAILAGVPPEHIAEAILNSAAKHHHS